MRLPRGLLLPVALALAPVFAQAPPEVRVHSGPWYPPGLVIIAEANLVELAATVLDRARHPVPGLKAADFEVLDDNRPREITFFSEQRGLSVSAELPAAAAEAATKAAGTLPATPPPLTAAEARSIGLFFDDVSSTMRGLHDSAAAAERLIGDGLAPADLLAIFTASGTVDVDFTTDRQRIRNALAHLRPHPLSAVHSSDACPQMTNYQAYVIAHHLDMMARQVAVAQAVACKCPDPTPECVRAQQAYVGDLAAQIWDFSRADSVTALDALGIVVRHMATAPGKRILVLLSPGLLTGGLEEHTSALVDIALRSNITIAALNSEGLAAPKMEPGAHARWEDRSIGQRETVLSEFLASAARSTGGQYIHNTNDLFAGLRAVTAVPEVSYLLGFAPERADGKYHSLKVRVRADKGYSVESRAGYFSAGLNRETETAQQRIDRIAMSSDPIGDFSAAVTLRQTAGEEGPAVNVTIAVDAGGLKFSSSQGRHWEQLTFLTVLEDAQGNFVAGKQSLMDLALLPATLAKFRKEGIRAAVSFPAPAGSYRVRQVVREAAQNRVWASTAAIAMR
jgi:VWFA-related protein